MIRKDFYTPIVGLVATLSTRDSLMKVAIPTIANQERQLDALVIVCDNAKLLANVEQQIRSIIAVTPVVILSNTRGPGAAYTWNAGIEYINNYWPEAYIAILDDDDTWEPNHLQVCEAIARDTHWPDVIVSGLRMKIDNEEIPRPAIVACEVEDFLIGNPGWQGSNTFIRTRTLIEAGLFTEGLSSCNDRDLAIRVLSLGTASFAFTGQHTATWHLETKGANLSSRRSEAKRAGLGQFFSLHGYRMDDGVRQRFFDRAESLFGWSKSEILTWDDAAFHA